MSFPESGSGTASTSSSTARPSKLEFPTGFRWGSATSSFQIEGAANEDGRGLSIWDIFCRQEGRIKDGSNGDIACDHYHRFSDDVALMSELGLQTYRFSIAWPRVVPDGDGEINPLGLDFYDRLVDELLAAGIEPFPTLYHWDLPNALEERGGWTERHTAEAFARYTEAVITRLGDRVGTWSTLNEPFVSANRGYVIGEHAPGRTSMADGMAASHHLLLAHGLAGQAIRALVPDARLACVINFTPMEPASESAADVEKSHHRNNLENRWYADPIAGFGYPEDTSAHFEWDQHEVRDGDLGIIAEPIDLLGVNFYSRAIVTADPDGLPKRDVPRNAMGWEIHPPSFGRLLAELDERYDFPAYMITENGAPLPDDQRTPDGRVDDQDRIDFLSSHIAQVHTAIARGMNVEGYLVWSLFDNFEWAWGYGPRFGIIEVDYETQERRPKESARWFSAAAAANAIEMRS